MKKGIFIKLEMRRNIKALVSFANTIFCLACDWQKPDIVIHSCGCCNLWLSFLSNNALTDETPQYFFCFGKKIQTDPPEPNYHASHLIYGSGFGYTRTCKTTLLWLPLTLECST